MVRPFQTHIMWEATKDCSPDDSENEDNDKIAPVRKADSKVPHFDYALHWLPLVNPICY